MLFFILSVIIIVITALLAPVGIRFSSEMYAAGEQVLADAQPTLDAINDTTIRNQVNATVASAKSAYSTNVSVSGALYNYSWIFLVIIAFLVVFIATRQLIQVGGAGGVV